MTTHREYQPLLCEEFSDEEQQYRCHRHQKLRHLKSRSRKKLKGAAHIIASWPGHWSIVKTIWLMLGVFALLIMALYNAVISITATQTADEVTPVFIHFFAEHINQGFYLSYIKMIAEDYPKLSYKLILVLNDTIENTAGLEDYELEFYNRKRHLETFVSDKLSNADFEEISLTKFLDESPLKRRWRDLPSEFLKFFVRAISVWNHGGIAINPLIVTPASSNGKYENELQNILRSFSNDTSNETLEQEDLSREVPSRNRIDIITSKPPKRYNNIRDIIEAIESEPPGEKSQVNLTEAESQRKIDRIQRKLLSVEQSISLVKSANNTNNHKLIHTHDSANQGNELTIVEGLRGYFNKFFLSPIRRNDNNVTSGLNNLPMIIDLFTYKLSPNLTDLKTAAKKSEFPIDQNISSINTESKIEKRDIKAETKYNVISKVNTLKPAIIPVSEKDQKINKTKDRKKNVANSNIKIFVDIKGNLLASSTPCHAFLGNIFTRIDKKPKDENLSKFLMSEISYFCHGRLSQCGSHGLDYIL